MTNVSNICSSILVDFQTNKTSVNELQNMGYDVIFTRPICTINKYLCGHADMQLCRVNDSFICAPQVFDYYKEHIQSELICGCSELKNIYPYDICYNVCISGNNAFHYLKYTDLALVNLCNREKINLINVKQGYSKCSTCVVSDNAIITADETIYNGAKKNNIDVLKIHEGYINLNGFEYGFIGGAAGLIEKNILAVNGTLKSHPDYNNIKSFCRNYNVNLAELSNNLAEDIGSIIKI